MSEQMRACAGLVAGVMLGCASAAAQTPSVLQTLNNQKPTIPRPFAIHTSPGGFWTIVGPGESSNYSRNRVADHFLKLDADRDGVLTERDAPLLREAGDKSKVDLLRVEFNAMDANHDGILTTEEVRAFRDRQLRDIEEKFTSAKREPFDAVAWLMAGVRVRAEEFLALDTNRDGHIDAAELRAGTWMTVGAAWVETGDKLVAQLTAARSLTAGAPQDVTKEMYLQAGEAYFRRIDIDHNGEVSFAERDAEAEALAAKACELPKPSSDAQIVVLSGQAPLISSVALGGTQSETQATRLIVEDGATPLYVIAIPPLSHETPFRPGTRVLWTLEGRTDRIERFVVAAPSGVGVSGLPENRATFLLGHYCLVQPFGFETAFSQRYDEVVAAFNAGVLARIGAATTALHVKYQDDVAIAVPSGRSSGKLPILGRCLHVDSSPGG